MLIGKALLTRTERCDQGGGTGREEQDTHRQGGTAQHDGSKQSILVSDSDVNKGSDAVRLLQGQYFNVAGDLVIPVKKY